MAMGEVGGKKKGKGLSRCSVCVCVKGKLQGWGQLRGVGEEIPNPIILSTNHKCGGAWQAKTQTPAGGGGSRWWQAARHGVRQGG